MSLLGSVLSGQPPLGQEQAGAPTWSPGRQAGWPVGLSCCPHLRPVECSAQGAQSLHAVLSRPGDQDALCRGLCGQEGGGAPGSVL